MIVRIVLYIEIKYVYLQIFWSTLMKEDRLTRSLCGKPNEDIVLFLYSKKINLYFFVIILRKSTHSFQAAAVLQITNFLLKKKAIFLQSNSKMEFPQ